MARRKDLAGLAALGALGYILNNRDETKVEDRFGPGDVEIADEADQHTHVAEAGCDCICLAATDAPLRFRGMMPRLLQPIFRI